MREGGEAAATRLAALIASSNDAFFDVDLADQTMRWSRGMTLLFGHQPDRVGTRVEDWQAFIHPDDAPEILDSGKVFLSSGAPSWVNSFRFRRADGSYAPVRVRSMVVREGGEPSHIVGSMADASELSEREDELHELLADLEDELKVEREERARGDSFLNSVQNEVLCESDLRTGRSYYSPNAETILGYRPEELGDLKAFIHPDDYERGARLLEQALASEVNFYASPPFRFRRSDGKEIRLVTRGYILRDEAGAPIRGVGTLVEVDPVSDAPVRGPLPAMSERQRHVIALVRSGLTNKEIAGELGVSEQAAKTQVRRLLRKFGVANRAALAAVPDLETA